MRLGIQRVTGRLGSRLFAIRFAVSAESRNLIIAAWNDSGVGKVWPPMLNHQIAQETDAQNGVRRKDV